MRSERLDEYAERKRSLIRKLKEVPCADCGKEYPYFVMDFDHKDPSKKTKTKGRGISDLGIKKLLQEVKDCDVVCANCHRIRSFTYGLHPHGKEES